MLLSNVWRTVGMTVRVKVAKEGEASLTDEKKAEIEKNMQAMDDAQTGGLAEYTRRANAAEESI